MSRPSLLLIAATRIGGHGHRDVALLWLDRAAAAARQTPTYARLFDNIAENRALIAQTASD